MMEKTATLNLRVDPSVKQNAEKVLKQLGVPMSVAIDMYLKQISLTGGIPFPISLPKAPASIDTDRMTAEEINARLEEGYADMRAGRIQDASDAFQRFRAEHNR